MKSMLTMRNVLLPLIAVALSACGSSNESTNSQKVGQQSSSSQSSSSVPSSMGAVDFIFPTQGAYVGDVRELYLSIDTKNTEKFEKYKVFNTEFIENGDQLITEQPISVEGELSQLPLDILGFSTEDQQWRVVDTLTINTKTTQFPLVAGSTRVYSVRGVALNANNGDVFYTNPYGAQVLNLDLVTGSSDLIYQGEPTDSLTEALYWPVAVDSTTDTVYVSADRANLSSGDGATYSVNLIAIQDASNSAMAVVYPDTGAKVSSTRGLVLDTDSTILSSSVQGQPYPTAYSLNNGSQPLMRWYLDGPQLGKPNPLNPAQIGNAKFQAQYGLAGLTATPNIEDRRLIGLREYSTIEFRGNPALVEIVAEDDGFGGFMAEARHLTDITGLVKPTAILHGNQGSHVFIADSDRIWQVDLATYGKQLVSSSSTLSPGLKGKGPNLGGKISAMAQHPNGRYLYVAADNNGLMMVDIETGDRITVAK